MMQVVILCKNIMILWNTTHVLDHGFHYHLCLYHLYLKCIKKYQSADVLGEVNGAENSMKGERLWVRCICVYTFCEETG